MLFNKFFLYGTFKILMKTATIHFHSLVTETREWQYSRSRENQIKVINYHYSQEHHDHLVILSGNLYREAHWPPEGFLVVSTFIKFRRNDTQL